MPITYSVRGTSRDEAGLESSSRFPAGAAFAGWFLSIGFDLFLHGGLLARLYAKESPFLLPPMEAFRRIPLGYLAFLILTFGLFWLLRRLNIRGLTAGFRYGVAAGALVWGAFVIGLYSISTATGALLVGWWVGQTVELGLAGAAIGAASGGTRLRRIWMVVVMAVIAFFIATVVLQTLGFAPQMGVSR